MAFVPGYSGSPVDTWTSSSPSIGFTMDVSGNNYNTSDNITTANFKDPLVPGVWLICANAYFLNAPNANILVSYPSAGAYGGINQSYYNTFYQDGGSGGGGVNYYYDQIDTGDMVLCSNTNFAGGSGSSNVLSASGVIIVTSDGESASCNPTLWMYSQSSGGSVFTSYSLSATRLG